MIVLLLVALQLLMVWWRSQ